MDALDLGCIDGSYSSRGKLNKKIGEMEKGKSVEGEKGELVTMKLTSEERERDRERERERERYQNTKIKVTCSPIMMFF